MAIVLDSQLAALNKNRVHRYATLWQISRSDGTHLRFTDHNTDIGFLGVTFESALGFQVSATQREAGLSEQNKEAQGITLPVSVAGSGITFEDMRAGKYRNARVKEWLVDWMYPWIGAIYETKYLLADIAFDGFVWRADLIGQAKFLRIPVGKIYNRNCRHHLGEAHHVKDSSGNVQMYEPHCGFDLAGNVNFTSEGGDNNLPAIVAQLPVTTIYEKRNEFGVSLGEGYPNNAWRYGICTFQVPPQKSLGTNAGMSFEIAKSTQSDESESTPSKIRLFVDTPHDIQVGDYVQLTVGCNKNRGHCKNRFNNFVNYGGFPHIPGADRAVLIPDTK